MGNRVSSKLSRLYQEKHEPHYAYLRNKRSIDESDLQTLMKNLMTMNIKRYEKYVVDLLYRNYASLDDDRLDHSCLYKATEVKYLLKAYVVKHFGGSRAAIKTTRSRPVEVPSVDGCLPLMTGMVEMILADIEETSGRDPGSSQAKLNQLTDLATRFIGSPSACSHNKAVFSKLLKHYLKLYKQEEEPAARQRLSQQISALTRAKLDLSSQIELIFATRGDPNFASPADVLTEKRYTTFRAFELPVKLAAAMAEVKASFSKYHACFWNREAVFIHDIVGGRVEPVREKVPIPEDQTVLDVTFDRLNIVVHLQGMSGPGAPFVSRLVVEESGLQTCLECLERVEEREVEQHDFQQAIPVEGGYLQLFRRDASYIVRDAGDSTVARGQVWFAGGVRACSLYGRTVLFDGHRLMDLASGSRFEPAHEIKGFDSAHQLLVLSNPSDLLTLEFAVPLHLSEDSHVVGMYHQVDDQPVDLEFILRILQDRQAEEEVKRLLAYILYRHTCSHAAPPACHALLQAACALTGACLHPRLQAALLANLLQQAPVDCTEVSPLADPFCPHSPHEQLFELVSLLPAPARRAAIEKVVAGLAAAADDACMSRHVETELLLLVAHLVHESEALVELASVLDAQLACSQTAQLVPLFVDTIEVCLLEKELDPKKLLPQIPNFIAHMRANHETAYCERFVLEGEATSPKPSHPDCLLLDPFKVYESSEELDLMAPVLFNTCVYNKHEFINKYLYCRSKRIQGAFHVLLVAPKHAVLRARPLALDFRAFCCTHLFEKLLEQLYAESPTKHQETRWRLLPRETAAEEAQHSNGGLAEDILEALARICAFDPRELGPVVRRSLQLQIQQAVKSHPAAEEPLVRKSLSHLLKFELANSGDLEQKPLPASVCHDLCLLLFQQPKVEQLFVQELERLSAASRAMDLLLAAACPTSCYMKVFGLVVLHLHGEMLSSREVAALEAKVLQFLSMVLKEVSAEGQASIDARFDKLHFLMVRTNRPALLSSMVDVLAGSLGMVDRLDSYSLNAFLSIARNLIDLVLKALREASENEPSDPEKLATLAAVARRLLSSLAGLDELHKDFDLAAFHKSMEPVFERASKLSKHLILNEPYPNSSQSQPNMQLTLSSTSEVLDNYMSDNESSGGSSSSHSATPEDSYEESNGDNSEAEESSSGEGDGWAENNSKASRSSRKSEGIKIILKAPAEFHPTLLSVPAGNTVELGMEGDQASPLSSPESLPKQDAVPSSVDLDEMVIGDPQDSSILKVTKPSKPEESGGAKRGKKGAGKSGASKDAQGPKQITLKVQEASCLDSVIFKKIEETAPEDHRLIAADVHKLKAFISLHIRQLTAALEQHSADPEPRAAPQSPAHAFVYHRSDHFQHPFELIDPSPPSMINNEIRHNILEYAYKAQSSRDFPDRYKFNLYQKKCIRNTINGDIILVSEDDISCNPARSALCQADSGLDDDTLGEVERIKLKILQSPDLLDLHAHELGVLALHFDSFMVCPEDRSKLFDKLKRIPRGAVEFLEPADLTLYLTRHKEAALKEYSLRQDPDSKKPTTSKFEEFRRKLKGTRVSPKPASFPAAFAEGDQNFYNQLSNWVPTVSLDLYMSHTFKSAAAELLVRAIEHDLVMKEEVGPLADEDFYLTVLRSLVHREQLFYICRDSAVLNMQFDQLLDVDYADIVFHKLMRFANNKTVEFFSFRTDDRLEQLQNQADSGVQVLADLVVFKRLCEKVKSPKLSLKFLLHLFDCTYELISMDLERDIVRKVMMLKLFEWYHHTLQTLDSESLLHALDSRLDKIKQYLSIYGLIDYGGFMKGQVCVNSLVEGVLFEAVSREMVSPALLDQIEDLRIRASTEELRRASRSMKQAKAASFEEYREELIRGILLMKSSCEKPTKLEASTTHVLYPRIPVRVTLPDYSGWAMTNIKSFGDTNDPDEANSDIIIQIQDSGKQMRQIFFNEDYNFTIQCFEINVRPGLRAACLLEDPPTRDQQVCSHELVLVRPPLRQNHIALSRSTPDSATAGFTINHKLTYLLNNYFDAASLHPTFYHCEEGAEFSVVSGAQFSDFSLLNENRITSYYVSRGTLLSYLPATNQIYANCPFDHDHIAELKVSCVDDRIDDCFYPPFGVVKKIERVCENRYLIRHSDDILVLLNLTSNLIEKNKIIHPALLQEYEDKLLAETYATLAEASGLSSKKKAFFREAHNRQNVVLDISKDRLVDYACGSKVVVLVVAPADKDHNLLTAYPTEATHKTVQIKRVPIVKMKGYDEKKKKAAVVLYADGRVGFISFNPKLIESGKFYIEFADGFFYTQICIWEKDWVLVGHSKQAEGQFAVRQFKNKKIEDHEMNQVLSLDKDSQIHESTAVLATRVGIKKECIFNEKYYHLVEYPLLFYLDLATADLVVRDLAGNPDFYREFLSLDLGGDNMCIMLMGPTLFQDKQDPNVKVNYSFVKHFLLQYKASRNFMQSESGQPLENKVIKDWSKDFLDPDCDQQQKWFADVDFPRVLIRFQGRVKADFQTLVDSAAFGVKEKNMVSFDVTPNVAELFGEEWASMKAKTETLWKPVLESLAPSEWFRLRDHLVGQTWSRDEDEDYYIQLVSGDAAVMGLDQNLQAMIKNSLKSFSLEQVYSIHCALAITHYKAGFYMDTHKFVGQKPVSFEVDEYVHNMFGTAINSSRATPSFSYQSSHMSIQVDRYRAEAATKEHPNMGFLNQLYYQLLVKCKWKLMHLFKMNGIELKFAGEDAYDAGGLLKEYFSGIAPEVTKKLGLFIRSPNYGEAVEENDRLIPNPAKTANGDLNEFKKFGFALGMAFWSFTNIGIDLPSSLWRYLHEEEFEWKDFPSIDARMFAFVEALESMDETDLADLDLTFSHTLYSTAHPVELKAGGSQVRVTPQNVCEYVARLKRLLVKSVRVPYEYIRLGFQKKIIPTNLAHSSPKLLETAITGSKTVTPANPRSTSRCSGRSRSTTRTTAATRA